MCFCLIFSITYCNKWWSMWCDYTSHPNSQIKIEMQFLFESSLYSWIPSNYESSVVRNGVVFLDKQVSSWKIQKILWINGDHWLIIGMTCDSQELLQPRERLPFIGVNEGPKEPDSWHRERDNEWKDGITIFSSRPSHWLW